MAHTARSDEGPAMSPAERKPEAYLEESRRAGERSGISVKQSKGRPRPKLRPGRFAQFKQGTQH